MSDQELTELLRRMSPRLDALDCENVMTAADRIEKVVRERDGLLRVVTDNHVALQRAEAAEAKLAKAMGRLKTMAVYNKYVVAPLLAELEGEG